VPAEQQPLGMKLSNCRAVAAPPSPLAGQACHFFDAPDVMGNTSFHRRGHAHAASQVAELKLTRTRDRGVRGRSGPRGRIVDYVWRGKPAGCEDVENASRDSGGRLMRAGA